jgi:hypothetical protein
MKQSRKDFIKQAHESACSDWKKNIEKEFPKLFKKDNLEVGKWYTDDLDQGFLVFITKIKGDKYYGFGFNGSGAWSEGGNGSWGSISNDIDRLATDKEVEQALIKEAKKRGFKEGVTVKSSYDKTHIRTIKSSFELSLNGLVFYCNEGNRTHLFNNGVWATIIKETITKEQAEKELGKTIEG